MKTIFMALMLVGIFVLSQGAPASPIEVFASIANQTMTQLRTFSNQLGELLGGGVLG